MHRSRWIIAPWVDPFVSSTRSLLPFGFCGKSLANPEAVPHRIHPVHPADRTLGMDHGHLLVRKSPGRFTLDGLDILGESSVRHFEFVDVEGIEIHTVHRGFVFITLIASHHKLTGRHQHHWRTIFPPDFGRGSDQHSQLICSATVGRRLAPRSSLGIDSGAWWFRRYGRKIRPQGSW